MSERQLLRSVELPLAVPVIVAGIRSAAVQIVATATLGAIFGFGGLGRYLVDGIAQRDDGKIFGGVAPGRRPGDRHGAALRALQRVLTPRGAIAQRRASARPLLRKYGRVPV